MSASVSRAAYSTVMLVPIMALAAGVLFAAALGGWLAALAYGAVAWASGARGRRFAALWHVSLFFGVAAAGVGLASLVSGAPVAGLPQTLADGEPYAIGILAVFVAVALGGNVYDRVHSALVERRQREWESVRGSGLGGDFSGASVQSSSFEDCCMKAAKFSGAALAGTRFADTDLSGSDFSGADIQGASFVGCDLRGCDFRGTTGTAAFDRNATDEGTMADRNCPELVAVRFVAVVIRTNLWLAAFAAGAFLAALALRFALL